MTDPLPPIDFDDSTGGRILAAARGIVLRERYSGLTMDRLALALGMSKKTLYVHFRSKEGLVAAVIAATGATIRREVDAALAAPTTFPAKMEAVLRVLSHQFGAIGPDFLQDLHRHAPQLYRQINELKDRHVPVVFGRMLEAGVAQGMVRDDLDVTFLAEYWLQVIKGVHDPGMLSRTGLSPREAFEKAVDMFFQGILTSAGRAGSRWALAEGHVPRVGS